MAKYLHGIHGPLAGRLGPLVASSWRGIPYLKTRPQRKKPYTRNELANQGKFATTSQWLSPISDFLRAGFKGDNPRKWGFNGAKSYLHAHALVNDGARKIIDPSKVLISQGNLPLAKDFKMHLDQETFEIVVRWNSSLPKAKEGGSAAAINDKLMLLAYDIEGKQAYGEAYGASRRAGVDRAEVEPGVVATYHVYVAFIASDGSSRSDSLYLGTISVGEQEESKEEPQGQEALSRPVVAEAMSQSAVPYQQKHDSLRQRPKIKAAFPEQSYQSNGTAKHRWQSSSTSSRTFSYTYSASEIISLTKGFGL